MEASPPRGPRARAVKSDGRGTVAGDTAADLLIGRLVQWGVDTVFGLPGDGINGIMEALRKRRDLIRFIQVRHEESAAFMATAYAKYTGRLGVCLATSGPGAVHLLNGLYDAKMDQAPVLALTGMTYHDLIGTFYQQDVNTEALFEDVAEYDERVMGAKHVTALVDIACRTSLSRRTVSHITFPNDLQEAPAPEDDVDPHAGWGHTGGPFVLPRVVPERSDLERAARILNEGGKVAILVGQGALGAGEEVEQLAEKLGAPVVKALLGKGVIADDSPYTTGGIGLLGTRPSEEAMEECDTFLMIGTSYPYMDYLPKPGQARAVQIDINPMRIGIRYPVDIGLVGDALATLRELLPLVEYHRSRSFLKKAQHGMRDWWKVLEKRGEWSGKPIKPQMVGWKLGEILAEDAIVSTDSGTITTWISRFWKLKRGQMFSLSGNLATMAPGLPYAIAAKLAFPERQSVAFVGDGGFTMLMGDFATAVKYDLPIVVVVIKNDVLGQIKWEQMVFLGNPEYGVELQPIDFCKFADACGGVGIHVEHPDQVRPALEQALAAGKPALVEVVTDPYEPPMPPKVHWDQAKNLATALMRGQPNRDRIALTLFRDRVDEIFGKMR
ncbi:MAG: thiamine pyrophosphate-binding protein [Chloroflexi bacterium]|nr:thiamine pyrophosphate-binding protein [Chloroflexota bacterium]